MVQTIQVADKYGRFLDAFVSLALGGGDTASITFESQGGGRNMDYIKAHNLVISRLAAVSATLVDALVVSSDTRNLSLADRRFHVPRQPYPIHLTVDVEGVSLARMLRRGAAEVGRREGATGPGNRAKRVEIRFSLANLGTRPPLWLEEQIIAPSGALDVEAILVATRPRSRRASSNYMEDAAARKAVEMRAMKVALDHLHVSWERVDDVSATESFDILCRSGAGELRVEVKGTTSDGATVVLTRNEVQHARDHRHLVALYVVSKIDLRLKDGLPTAAGGVLTQHHPWNVDEFELIPISFQCLLTSEHGND